MLVINPKIELEKTKKLLEKYRELLKGHLSKTKIEKNSIVIYRSKNPIDVESANLIKSDLDKVSGHSDFKLIVTHSYDTIDVILKDKLEIITGKDIINKWKSTKGKPAEEREKIFQEYLIENNLCKGCENGN